MIIYNEIDVRNENRIIIKNYMKDLERYRTILSNFRIDFSSINKLRGNRDLLQRAFNEELNNK